MKFLLAAAILITASGSLFSQSSRGGSLFYEEMRLLEGAEREKLIVKEINFVKSDYLAAGSDDDYFTLPMTPQSAQKIAEFFNASLPTPFIVDIIYKKAELKLEPFNFIPRRNRNETPDLFYDHSKIVHAQKKASGSTPGVFTAGTKKDIVISSKLSDPRRTHHVTIYGWHRLTGIPIQPVTNIHIDTSVDYSHGVRLLSNKILIDGKEYDYRVILRDSTLYSLLSSEKEPLTVTSYNY